MRAEVGQRVRWNGSCPPSRPRWYTGEVVEVKECTVLVVDDEWFATSEVAIGRLLSVETCPCCGYYPDDPEHRVCPDTRR